MSSVDEEVGLCSDSWLSVFNWFWSKILRDQCTKTQMCTPWILGDTYVWYSDFFTIFHHHNTEWRSKSILEISIYFNFERVLWRQKYFWNVIWRTIWRFYFNVVEVGACFWAICLCWVKVRKDCCNIVQYFMGLSLHVEINVLNYWLWLCSEWAYPYFTFPAWRTIRVINKRGWFLC